MLLKRLNEIDDILALKINNNNYKAEEIVKLYCELKQLPIPALSYNKQKKFKKITGGGLYLSTLNKIIIYVNNKEQIDLFVLLHELRHVEQYHEFGVINEKDAKNYVKKLRKTIIKDRKVEL